MSLRVGVVGATGMVGRTMLRVLAERELAIDELRPMSSARSAGKRVEYRGSQLTVVEATAAAFTGLDIVLFSAGASASRALAPVAVAAGAVVIDNSSAWR